MYREAFHDGEIHHGVTSLHQVTRNVLSHQQFATSELFAVEVTDQGRPVAPKERVK